MVTLVRTVQENQELGAGSAQEGRGVPDAARRAKGTSGGRSTPSHASPHEGVAQAADAELSSLTLELLPQDIDDQISTFGHRAMRNLDSVDSGRPVVVWVKWTPATLMLLWFMTAEPSDFHIGHIPLLALQSLINIADAMSHTPQLLHSHFAARTLTRAIRRGNQSPVKTPREVEEVEEEAQKDSSESKWGVDEESVRNMILLSTSNIVGAMSSMLQVVENTSLIQYILKAYQAYTRTCGELQLVAQRDELLVSLCQFSLPGWRPTPGKLPPSSLLPHLWTWLHCPRRRGFPCSEHLGLQFAPFRGASNRVNPQARPCKWLGSMTMTLAGNINLPPGSAAAFQVFKTLFNIAHCLGDVLGTSWIVLLDTFQQFYSFLRQHNPAVQTGNQTNFLENWNSGPSVPRVEGVGDRLSMSVRETKGESTTSGAKSGRRASKKGGRFRMMREGFKKAFRLGKNRRSSVEEADQSRGHSQSLAPIHAPMATGAATSTGSPNDWVFEIGPSSKTATSDAGLQEEINILAQALSTLFLSTRYLSDAAVSDLTASMADLCLTSLAAAAMDDDDESGPMPQPPPSISRGKSDAPVSSTAEAPSSESASSTSLVSSAFSAVSHVAASLTEGVSDFVTGGAASRQRKQRLIEESTGVFTGPEATESDEDEEQWQLQSSSTDLTSPGASQPAATPKDSGIATPQEEHHRVTDALTSSNEHIVRPLHRPASKPQVFSGLPGSLSRSRREHPGGLKSSRYKLRVGTSASEDESDFVSSSTESEFDRAMKGRLAAGASKTPKAKAAAVQASQAQEKPRAMQDLPSASPPSVLGPASIDKQAVTGVDVSDTSKTSLPDRQRASSAASRQRKRSRKEPSFVLLKLIETARANVHRLALFWPNVVGVLAMLSQTPYENLRNYGIQALTELIVLALEEGESQDAWDDSGASLDTKAMPNQLVLVAPLLEYWRCSYSQSRLFLVRVRTLEPMWQWGVVV